MLFEVLARMERARMWMDQFIDRMWRERDERDRLYDKATQDILREDGYIEVRRSRDWDPGDWR